MLGYKRKRLELINMMCRACGKEDPDAVAIFSETGKRQNILKKIHACLPIHIHENDNYPNKICLSCLTKLDASWDWYISCKTAQIDIEQKLYELRNQKSNQFHKMGVEEKLRNLSESYPVSYGESAVICLAREPSPTPTPPPPAVNRETVDPVMTTVTYLTSASTSAAVPPTSSRAAPEEIFPQALIQVPQNTASEPIMYQMSTPAPALAPATPAMPTVIKRRPPTLVPKPKTSPVPVSATTTSQPSNSAPAKRKNSETLNGPNAKKECVYCKKLFTDDIIDHHVSLHLRQSFSSCVECGKNFRSEEAMQRHRCGDKKNHETINLDDDDDDELIIV